MDFKLIIWLTILFNFWNCSPEINFQKTKSPAVFIDQIHFALKDNSHNKIVNLLVNKEDLIITLTEEKKALVYNYETQFFNMATDDKLFKSYKKKLLKSFNTIKDTPINWKSIQIQKANYETDSLQININGLLIVRDTQNNTDSIHFKGIKLQNNWSLTSIH